jgi:ParB family chromosome partitioning protein
MTKERTVLGRGLASLIARQPAAAPPAPAVRGDDGVSTEVIASVELERIQKNPYQPRADFDQTALDELARSIRDKGVIQPITVRRYGDGYQLISGERRVRAARAAGLTRIPAYIITVGTDEEMLELALIENLQRETLNPIEIAISYRRLIEECSYTQEEVALKIGKDRSTITNFLRLLKLPEVIQTALRTGELSSGHARSLVAIEDAKTQMTLFRRILDQGLSVREIERLVRGSGTRKPRPGRIQTATERSTLASIEERLRQFLGTKVQVRSLQHGKGEIIIEYYSADDLDRILDLLEELRERSR